MGNEASTPLSSLEKLQATNCRIVVLGPKSGDDCLLELVNLPNDARILATGTSLEELKKDGNMFSEVSLPFVRVLWPRAAGPLPMLRSFRSASNNRPVGCVSE